jgi:hypothetical protein
LLSPIADTVITLGLLAGEKLLVSFPALPAATTKIIPELTN